jgi:hypothetical protein
MKAQDSTYNFVAQLVIIEEQRMAHPFIICKLRLN